MPILALFCVDETTKCFFELEVYHLWAVNGVTKCNIHMLSKTVMLENHDNSKDYILGFNFGSSLNHSIIQELAFLCKMYLIRISC